MTTRSELIDAIKKHQMYVLKQPGGRRMQLRNGNLSRIKMSKVSLEDAVLPGSNFIQATIREVKFDFCDLFGTNFVEADLEGSSFVRADLRGANMARAKLRNANLKGADLRSGVMVIVDAGREKKVKRTTDLTHTDLQGSILSGANMSESNLSGARLADADLSDANMFAANLAGADLSGCNLSGAKLKNANLKGARLKGCLLMGTDLSGANLRNVDLSAVDLSQANIANSIGSHSVTPLPEDIRALINSHTEWLTSGGASGSPLNVTGRDLSELDFSGLDLSAACFDDCILRGVLFVDTILAMTSMRNVDMSRARLSGAVMNGVRMSYANCSKTLCQGVKFGGVEQRDAKGNKTGDVWRADLTSADFSQADLRNSVFDAPQMKGVLLCKANIAGVAFGETDLSEVDLTGANIGSILSGNVPPRR
jgi:uncharacterized protein YjbI with pentapeptide repeats